MSQRTNYPVRARSPECVEVQGKITWSSGGNALLPMASQPVVTGVTAYTRNGAGDVTITLDDVYPQLDHAEFSLFGTSNGHAFAVTADNTAVATGATARTLRFVLKTNSGGTFTAADPGASASVGYILRFKNRVVRP